MNTNTSFHTLLTPAALSLQETVSAFTNETLAPLVEHIEAHCDSPKEIWLAMGKANLLGITAAKAYAGLGLGLLEQIVAMETISQASPALGLSYAAHANLCVNQLDKHGSEQQKQHYLPPLISGEHRGALALSEPNAGSDAVSIQMTATLDNDQWVLNGTKQWITNGPEADVILVYAKTDPKAGAKGISAFIVPGDAVGLSRGATVDKMGMRGSNTCKLFFEQCAIPQANLLGELNQGVKVMMSGLDAERLVLSAGPVGIMQACLDVLLPFVQEREQFGQPIAEFQLIQAKIADIYTMLQASRSYLYSLAQNFDQLSITEQRIQAASVFLMCSENATQVALETIQAMGARGYSHQYPVSRYLRDAKAYEIGGGTTEIRRLLIARELLKEYHHAK